jgi:hypothetical protein
LGKNYDASKGIHKKNIKKEQEDESNLCDVSDEKIDIEN